MGRLHLHVNADREFCPSPARLNAVQVAKFLHAMSITGFSRRLVAFIRLGIAVVVSLILFLSGAQALPETRRFEITRNGEPIGTHVIEVNRSGNEFLVSVVTDLTVKVLFVTAYRLQIAASERWANGRLIALNSTSNNNGTRHVVSAVARGPRLEVTVDGKDSIFVDPNVMPNSFWNAEFLRRPIMLDAQDGQVIPVSVRDVGEEDLTINASVIRTRRYTVISRYSQDVWYDDQARLVKAQLVARDGSVIMYRLL
jgi:Family of unknown function (DUF6134)